MNVTWERWWLAGTSTGRLYGGGGPLTGRPGNVKNSAWARFGGIILQRMVWGDGQKRFFRKCASVPCAGGCAEKSPGAVGGSNRGQEDAGPAR
jgi:hypothetical protein